MPPLVDNGNTVPLSVAVDSPMTSADHVKAIHVLTEKNPQPYVVSAYLGPRAGRARIATRARIADTGKVIAIAQLSDGSFWSDTVSVVVTLSACLERDDDLMARVVVNVPASAKRGEVIEIRTLAGHPMETGFRRTQTGS